MGERVKKYVLWEKGSMKGDVKRKHYSAYWKLFNFSASSPFG
jgi:hypothetical protein